MTTKRQRNDAAADGVARWQKPERYQDRRKAFDGHMKDIGVRKGDPKSSYPSPEIPERPARINHGGRGSYSPEGSFPLSQVMP